MLKVFKQVSAHLPHEANDEQYFSRAVSSSPHTPAPPSSAYALCIASLLASSPQGLLSDPNVDPFYLGIFVMVGITTSTCDKFKPTCTLQAFKERYFQKFRWKGSEGIDEH